MRRSGDLTQDMTSSIIGDVMIYYILGWVSLLAYLPLFCWRRFVEDRKHEKNQAGD